MFPFTMNFYKKWLCVLIDDYLERAHWIYSF